MMENKNQIQYVVNKRDMLLLIMDYLRQEGYDQSYISLEQESGVNLYNYDEKIDNLRRVILDGDWEEVEKFINENKQKNVLLPYNNLIFEIKKEKLLEEVELQNNEDVLDELAQELKELQGLGLNSEFNELINYLKLSNDEDQKVNIISRRLNTFLKVRNFLTNLFPVTNDEILLHPGKLALLLSRMLEKINVTDIKNERIVGLSDIETILESSSKGNYTKEIIETEPNKNTIIQNNISTTNNENKNFLNERNNNRLMDIYEDYELNLQIQNDNSNDNSNNITPTINNNNDLSDLDQEEYYMKRCYDFYNYDITSLTLKKVIEDTLPIRCACFSPKGEYFAIGTNSKSLKIFDLSYVLENFNKRNSYARRSTSQRETIGMIFEQKNYHNGSIYSIDWSSSGKLIATGSNDKTIKLINIPQLESTELAAEHEMFELTISGLKGIVRYLSFEPTNDLVLLSAISGENNVKVWDTEKGVNTTNLIGHAGEVKVVKWSNDNQLCASAGIDKTVRFWDIRDDKTINLISGIKYADINDISIFTKPRSSTLIACGHDDGLITIWDYAKRCVVKEITEHPEKVRSVSFSPDGKYLISGSYDFKVKIYDVNNNFDLMGELEHTDRVVSCIWHPEIPLIVSTSADKTARVWIPQKY